ncbi:hypothetical protein TCAL_07996 [Tigriopus californicus]|uniref:Threonine synthase-like 2 n=1 Tax=Tigriopus californicus TaxID=6832 RepID=A0A553PEY6_TIGCA|nr:threonine synthase-like 2 [Tigriopus californicus]TRY76247.1 hypothetical protein TCAL_07996 [Tigriopus californicus]|eukprot:TCALIF_07996-PA protein Name:"Similar to THNSL2 Threonine synthase-like 2 (Pongo abelii)" AED:0.06 eAED:0.06 QI:115/1/1/1/0.5/0.57/7/86/482
MKYCSTRGGETGLTFEDVLFSGYAKDGGLYLPEEIPVLTGPDLTYFSQLSYTDLVIQVLSRFIDSEEIPEPELARLVRQAHATFETPDVVQLKYLTEQLTVAELFHGTTLTFKDLALSVVGRLCDFFLEKRRENLIVVVATSGDTGSAAIESVQNLSWVDIIVLLPKGRCTPIQELQMTTVIKDNVHVFAGDGSSDDLDVPIKSVFQNSAYVKKHHLCSINSINVARILLQTVHYLYCYFQLRKDPCDQPMQFIVPTGACGNITGGYIASQMGIPLQLIPVTNENDIVARTLTSGDFSISEEVKQSWACAIDIQCPYNLERLFYLAANRNTQTIRHIMDAFENEYQTQIQDEILSELQKVIPESISVTNPDILMAMGECFRTKGYTICPHTAVGYKYACDTRKSGKVKPLQVILSTASPLKFPEALEQAGLKKIESKKIDELFQKPTRFTRMDRRQDWESILKDKIEEISAQWAKRLLARDI